MNKAESVIFNRMGMGNSSPCSSASALTDPLYRPLRSIKALQMTSKAAGWKSLMRAIRPISNGWTSDALGLALLRLFDKVTRHKGSRRRLSILDGKSSHVN